MPFSWKTIILRVHKACAFIYHILHRPRVNPRSVDENESSRPVQQEQRSPLLEDIPVELLWLIFERLPVPSQACLALTCKHLYRLYHFVLKDKQLAWPKLLASKECDVPLDQPDLPRNQLLLQLEDDRWLYCPYCTKLHPPELIQRESLDPPYPRICRNAARVVDLCPCLALTFLDGVRLKEWLQQEDWENTGPPEKLPASVQRAFKPVLFNKERYLQHRCSNGDPSMGDPPDAFCRLLMMININAYGRLIIRTRYDLDMPIAWPVYKLNYRWYWKYRTLAPIFPCPHFEILAFICAPDRYPNGKCRLCATIVYDVRCSFNRDFFSIRCSRDLGPCEWVYLAWGDSERSFYGRETRSRYLEPREGSW